LAIRRTRRLALVALLFPGAVLAIAGAQILARPALVLAGLAWLAAGLTAWRIIAPRLLSPPLAPREVAHPQEIAP
jgi:hypothetical protein